MTTLTQLIEQYCPNGVDYVKLGNVATYYRGLTYSKKNEVKSGGLKVLRANNVSLNTQRIDWNDVKTVELDKPVKPTCLLKQDDILMVANSGSKAHVGKIAYINQDFVDVAFGGFMATIRAKDTRSSRYIYHVLSSDEFKAYKDSVLSSATINNLKKSIVEEFKIPLPPREVQDAIVERLDAFAALIESLDSEIALREKRFEYFREQLLTFNESDGVEYVKLGEVAEIITGKTPKTSEPALWGGSTPFVTPTDFANGYDSHGRTARYVSDQALQAAKTKVVGSGATLVTCIASIGGVAFVTEQCLTNQQINAVIPSEKLIPRFVYYVMQESADYLRSLGGSGTMPIVNKAKFSGIPIPLPPREVQQDIADKLDTMQALIDNLKQERELRQVQFEYYREKLLTFNS